MHTDAPHFIKLKDFLLGTLVKVRMRVDTYVSAALLAFQTELLFPALRLFHTVVYQIDDRSLNFFSYAR